MAKQSNILPPPMSATTKEACRLLSRISEWCSSLKAETELNGRGLASAFGIDMDNPQHVEWLSDIEVDLLQIVHRAHRMGFYAPGGLEFDERGPK